jgi:hypothetical protein
MCGHDRRRARRLVAILQIMVGSMEEMLRQLDLLILAHDRGSKLTDDELRQLRENQTHGGETSRSLSSG